MGRTKATEMLCFGKKLDANEAKERNLVTQIFPHQTFQQNVQVSLIHPYQIILPSFNIHCHHIKYIFSSCYAQEVLESVVKELPSAAFNSTKRMIRLGAGPQALHLVNKREVEELKVRFQSPECVEAALKVIMKSRSNKSNL